MKSLVQSPKAVTKFNQIGGLLAVLWEKEGRGRGNHSFQNGKVSGAQGGAPAP